MVVASKLKENSVTALLHSSPWFPFVSEAFEGATANGDGTLGRTPSSQVCNRVKCMAGAVVVVKTKNVSQVNENLKG